MSLVDAIAIIGGSAVGGGFLAVPAVTAPLGLLPSASAMVATWVYLVLSGLAYVDAACMSEGIDTDGASVLAISRRCFGNGVAALFSLLCVAQMLAIVSANLVKAAELSASLLPRLPFPAAVLLAAAGFGAFVFGAAPATVAAANTLLAGCMLTGFLTLFALAAAAPAPAAAAAVAAPSAHWAGLLPRRGWPIPIFVNTLRFGEVRTWPHLPPLSRSLPPTPSLPSVGDPGRVGAAWARAGTRGGRAGGAASGGGRRASTDAAMTGPSRAHCRRGWRWCWARCCLSSSRSGGAAPPPPSRRWRRPRRRARTPSSLCWAPRQHSPRPPALDALATRCASAVADRQL